VGHDLSLEVKNANLFLRNIKKKLDKSWDFVLSGEESFLRKDFLKS